MLFSITSIETSSLKYFFISLFLFWFYFIAITIFGFFVLYTFTKRSMKRISLREVLKCYAIGQSLHIVFALIMLSVRIYCFTSVYLPILICDSIFLLRLVYNKKKRQDEKLIKGKLYKFLVSNKEFILIFSIIVIMQVFLQMYVINRLIPYPQSDPYYWFNNTLFVLKYRFLNYDLMKAYTPGFVIVCSTPLSIFNDYHLIYYFLKYFPIFIMTVNLLALYEISSSIFVKKSNIFFTLVIFLSFNYLFYRYSMPLPTLLTTNLGIIFTLFIDRNLYNRLTLDGTNLWRFFRNSVSDKNTVIKGIILTGQFMFHPLYFIIFIISFISYEFSILIIGIVKNFKTLKNKVKVIVKFIIINITMLMIFGMLTFPYIISSSFSLKTPLPSFFLKYFYKYSNWEGISYDIVEDLILFYNSTLGIGFLLIVIGVFLPNINSELYNKKKRNLVGFFKFTFLFSLIIILFFNFIYYIDFIDVRGIVNFFKIYRKRVFELFAGFWAILFVLSLKFFFIILHEIFLQISAKKKTLYKLAKKFYLVQFICILGVSVSLYVSNYERIYYLNHYNNSQTNAVLQVGSYFHENPISSSQILLLQYLEPENIYYLIVEINLGKLYYNFTFNTNYTDFIQFWELNNCSYIFLNINNLNNNFKQNFSIEFLFLYEDNNGYVFAQNR